MKYKIVSRFDLDDLEEYVNEKISEGYKPVGGVSVLSRKGMETIFIQALCKDGDV